MCVFTELKARLPFPDVYAYHTGSAIGNKPVKCPLHDDKTASFKHYPATNSFSCFGCGAGGTVIDFVAALHKETPLDAAKRLDVDFGLGLFGGNYRPDARLNDERKKAAENINGFLAMANSVFDYLCSEYRVGEWVLKPDNRIYESGGRGLYVHYAHTLGVVEYHKNGLCEALNDFDHYWAKSDADAVRAAVETISTILGGYVEGGAYEK